MTDTPKNYCNCPQCQTVDCPAGRELAAPSPSAERVEIRRLEAESAAFHDEALICNAARMKAEARVAELEKDAKRWNLVRPMLTGENTPEANAITLGLAAGLMRNETIEQITDGMLDAAIDAARREHGQG